MRAYAWLIAVAGLGVEISHCRSRHAEQANAWMGSSLVQLSPLVVLAVRNAFPVKLDITRTAAGVWSAVMVLQSTNMGTAA